MYSWSEQELNKLDDLIMKSKIILKKKVMQSNSKKIQIKNGNNLKM